MLTTVGMPKWRRIYRQTLTLIYKNFLLYYKAPISTTIRALIFPIILTIILCELKHISVTSPGLDNSLNGISSTSYPIRDLADAISATSQRKLVFVRNGLANDSLALLVDGILQEPGMESVDTLVTDDPNELFGLCRQSIQGSSDCFAAVIFSSFNDTTVEYIIALDDSITNDYTSGDYRTDTSLLADRILPIQWAVDSHIGNVSTVNKPSEQPWTGSFESYSGQQGDQLPSLGSYVCVTQMKMPHLL